MGGKPYKALCVCNDRCTSSAPQSVSCRRGMDLHSESQACFLSYEKFRRKRDLYVRYLYLLLYHPHSHSVAWNRCDPSLCAFQCIFGFLLPPSSEVQFLQMLSSCKVLVGRDSFSQKCPILLYVNPLHVCSSLRAALLQLKKEKYKVHRWSGLDYHHCVMRWLIRKELYLKCSSMGG